jgi:cell division protein FtsQ
MRKYNWKKILFSILWMIAGIGAIVLLGAAMQKKGHKICSDIKIEITGAEQHMFIDEKDVLTLLNATGRISGNKIASLNLREMERIVEKNAWVRNAEMFLDNNQVLQVRIEERQPVARVFTMEGSSFYVDSASMRLPLSEKISARVPSFTGFPSAKNILSKPDSALLDNIVKVGRYILADSFWMAQVAQIDITSQANFEMIPVIGDHIVVLGNADDLDRKFKHLFTFYRQAWLQNGMNSYEKLDVQYNNQVVAIRKGTTKAMVDSFRAHQLMQGLSEQAQTNFADSSYISNTSLVKPKVAKPVKDSAVIAKPVKAINKVPSKTNSATVVNNKTDKKSLTNEKKQQSKQQVKKKPVNAKKRPKAVMNK